MTKDYNKQLFGEIERFIQMKIDGKNYEVPDKLELLRVFQFLDFTIDYARLCWNGSCHRCNIGFEVNGKKGEGMSCRMKSFEGVCVTKLPPTIKPS